MTAIESCRNGGSNISYEQAMTVKRDSGVHKIYYVVDVTALYIKEKLSGFVAIFKDVTQLKKEHAAGTGQPGEDDGTGTAGFSGTDDRGSGT